MVASIDITVASGFDHGQNGDRSKRQKSNSVFTVLWCSTVAGRLS